MLALLLTALLAATALTVVPGLDRPAYVPGVPLGWAVLAGLFALTSKKLPEGVLADAITRVQFTENPLEDTLLKMAQWSHEIGFLKEQPKLDGLVDTSALRTVQQTETQGGKP